MTVRSLYVLIVLSGIFAVGCVDFRNPDQLVLLSVPLEVNGESVGEAYVDTGGGYEVLLRETFGLNVVDKVEVLAFGGKEQLSLTEPFRYAVDGYNTVSPGAIVGLSACNCNGLGYHFFRRTGIVLGLDFPTREARFHLGLPIADTYFGFEEPPAQLPDFDSSFIEVEIEGEDGTEVITALLDTGANVSVVKRGLVGNARPLTPDRIEVNITHENLGTVRATVGLFDTQGLPDMIIGTDIMRTWADEWYFDFSPHIKVIGVIFHADGSNLPQPEEDSNADSNQ